MKSFGRFTVRQILDAMRADKTPKAKSEFDDGRGGHCAYGGAALVLGVPPQALRNAVADVGTADKLGYSIIKLNDDAGLSKASIANRIAKAYPQFLDTIVEVTI